MSMYEISSPNEFFENKTDKYEWINILEKTSTTVSTLNQYEFIIRNTDDWLRLYDAYVAVKFSVSTGTNQALCNGAYSIFSRAVLRADGNVLEDVRQFPLAQVVKKVMETTPNNEKSLENEFFYLDDTNNSGANTYGANGVSQSNEHGSTGHASRITRCASANNVFCWMPVREMFSFVKSWNKVHKGIKFEMSFEKNSNNEALLCSLGTPALTVNDISLWMPVIKPSLQQEAELITTLNNSQTLPLKWIRHQVEVSNSSTNSGQRLRIATLASKPRRVIVGLQENGRINNNTTNSNIFDNAQLKSIYLRYNATQVPQEMIEVDYATGDWARAYLNFLKENGKEDPMDGSVVDYENFATCYPLYVFDLSSQPDKLFESGQLADLEVVYTLGASINHRVVCFIDYEREASLNLSNNRMTIVY